MDARVGQKKAGASRQGGQKKNPKNANRLAE
jgi:hypothetical protein